MQLASSVRGYGLLGAFVVASVYAYVRDGGDEVSATPRASEPAKPTTSAQPAYKRAVQPPTLAVGNAVDEEPIVEDEDTTVRGHEPISGPDEFAMLFTVGDDTYVRLSTADRATSRGRAKLTESEGVYAVVAPVTASALPAKLRDWQDREVFVDGECRARVVGFAEVSRAVGNPEGTYDDETGEYTEAHWTTESLTAANVTLAAKLDSNCPGGTWARAASYPVAKVAEPIKDAELEQAAVAALLGKSHDQISRDWTEWGGQGNWRDQVEVVTNTYVHPDDGERWVFVQARTGGSCGEASVSLMSVYREGADGTPREMTTLSYAWDELSQVVDLDGDGQPELIFGRAGYAQLVDLTDNQHDTMHIDSYQHEGCGC